MGKFHFGLRAKAADGAVCPFQYVTLGGHTFHRHTEKVEGYGADTRRDRVQGGYGEFDEREIARVRKALEGKRVRVLNRDPGNPKGKLFDVKSSRYQPQPGDERLEKWVYMTPHEGATPYEETFPDALDVAPAWKPDEDDPDDADEVAEALASAANTPAEKPEKRGKPRRR